MADECPKCPPVGAPNWLATFADLMSLLMCFFVLLLSFATMDANKLRKVSQSLEDAFGVQRDVPAFEVPLGTSIIAQHFSPAMTTPTVLDEVRQIVKTPNQSVDMTIIEQVKRKIVDKAKKDTKDQSQKIKEALKNEIKQGLVSIETDELRIIIRINDKGSFDSGTAELKRGFTPVMQKITDAVLAASGKVLVSGHTDDLPISTDWYRSNWELSSGRAVSIASAILENGKLDANRLVVQGYADTKPLVENNSPENRAVNRRVEIMLEQTPEALYQEELEKFEKELDDYKQERIKEGDAPAPEPVNIDTAIKVDASLVESIDTTPVAELPESSVESNPEPVINEAVTENLSDMVNDLLNAPGNAETE
mgnify:CR=1 FL=1